MATQIQNDLVRMATIKAAIEVLTVEKREVETRLVEGMKTSQVKSSTADIDGETIKGTLVEAERVTIDEAKLKKALSAAQWKKVTTLVLDKEKLEAAVVQNIVDGQLVAGASEIKQNKPYIKVTGTVPVAVVKGVSPMDSRGNKKPAARKRVVRPKQKV